MNDERACAEYFCCARSAFTDIPDADDLVHAQVFKDMARSYAQVLLLSFLCMCSAFLFFSTLDHWFLLLSRRFMRCGSYISTRRI